MPIGISGVKSGTVPGEGVSFGAIMLHGTSSMFPCTHLAMITTSGWRPMVAGWSGLATDAGLCEVQQKELCRLMKAYAMPILVTWSMLLDSV